MVLCLLIFQNIEINDTLGWFSIINVSMAGKQCKKDAIKKGFKTGKHRKKYQL